MNKKIIISGYLGFKNFGDEAILSILVNKLQSLGIEDITVISSDTEYTKTKFQNIQSVGTFDIKNIIFSILKSDILISGGGSLLQDATSFKSLIYYLFIIFMGLFFRKKVIIFAQGIGPINNKLGKLLTKILLLNCNYVSVRDSKSHELLTQWGIKSDLLCDPIFSLKFEPSKKLNTVAIQLRNYKTLTQDFIDRLAQEIVTHFSDKEIQIYPFQNNIDLEVCKNLETNIKMLNSDIKISVMEGLTDSQIVENLSKSEYLIAMRFHAVIIGLLTKTKTLAINYDIKVEKIANEFGLPILDMKKPFSNQFEKLKEQDIESIYNKVNSKYFDWKGFEKIINF